MFDLPGIALADGNAFVEATADEQILIGAGRLAGDSGVPTGLFDGGEECLDSGGAVSK